MIRVKIRVGWNSCFDGVEMGDFVVIALFDCIVVRDALILDGFCRKLVLLGIII